jgi:DNA-binding beta-propeller fold protein YncE
VKPHRRLFLAGLVAAAALATTIAIAATSSVSTGRIGPANRIQPNGRKLNPVGKLTKLGNFPTNGRLTPDGKFLWTLSAGRGLNDIRIVNVKSRKVVQIIRVPGNSGGLTLTADGKTAYVSGVADSPYTDEKTPEGTPGQAGDVIQVLSVDKKSGKATLKDPIPVPPPSSAAPPQNFPPTGTTKRSWPRDVAVTKDGKKLLVALNLSGSSSGVASAAVIDVATKAVTYVDTGDYPYGAAITSDGKTGLVGSEVGGTVTAINMADGTKIKDIQAGPRLSHPESIAIDPKRPRAYVPLANQDMVAVIDTKKLAVSKTLSVEKAQGLGTSPTNATVSSDGCRLFVTNSGEDAVAIFSLVKKCTRKPKALANPKLLGKVPVGSYPTWAGETPHNRQFVWVSARGLGVGPNPNGPNPLSPNDSDNAINTFNYLPAFVTGATGIAKGLTDKQIRGLTKKVNKQITPANFQKPPAGTPIVAPTGTPKIKYVWYFVRENRTYDQVLGDDSRGDGDPKLTLFGKDLTPNVHALVQRFPLLDHVYANSEASIDGHYWAAAGAVTDYVVKSWHQNYAGRGRPYDFGAYVVSDPPNGFLFDQATKDGVKYYNYGEAVAEVSPFPDRNRTQDETARNLAKFANTDGAVPVSPNSVPGGKCYPSDIAIGTDPLANNAETWDSTPPAGAPVNSESRFDCFNAHYAMPNDPASDPSILFRYFSLPSDHTQGLSPGKRTPQAMVAENDYGLGQFVEKISHSPFWKQSMILVLEDDSQDGADHVDAHRMPALVISPYAKKGAVVHTRYDFPSFLRTMEIVLGMHPLTLNDAVATPLYDAFSPTADNSDPYTAIKPAQDLNARNANTAANRAAVRGADFRDADHVPQRRLDGMLWHAVHGMDSQPPPPGPNASGEDTQDRDGY